MEKQNNETLGHRWIAWAKINVLLYFYISDNDKIKICIKQDEQIKNTNKGMKGNK